MPGDSALEAVSAASQAGAATADALSGASAAAVPTGLALVLAKAEYFVLVPMVYLALSFLLVATALVVARAFRRPPPFQLALYPARKRPFLAALGDAFGMGQVRRRKPLFWAFLAVFHAGLLLLLLGHLDLSSGVNLVPPDSRHMLGSGVVGLMVTVPAFYFLGRRFRGVDRQISVPSDYLLLLLLVFLFLLGDLMSWGNSWTASGFVMTKADFALYFDGLAGFTFADPRAVLRGSHYHFVVLHVLLANIFIMILPFSKIVHAFFSIPLNAVRRTVWLRRAPR